MGEGGSVLGTRTKLLVALGVGVFLVGALLAFLVPKLLGWFVAGGAAGGVALARAAKGRRQADKDHAANIAAETRTVGALQANVEAAVAAAQERADKPPEDTGTAEDRQAALDAAADLLR